MTRMTDDATQEQHSRNADLIWWIICAFITAVACVFRFAWLGLKPFHHDEGVNGFFLTNLIRDGVYKYDPANYHGPTLYYIAWPFVQLFGLNTIPVRVSVAIFGVGVVLLAFYLKPYIGRTGSIFAALFLALSPGMVYISRYFIHEIFFVFLSLAVVIAITHFIERKSAGIVAIGCTMLLLAVCFIPSGLMLGGYLGGETLAAVWAFRIAVLVVDAVLIYFVMRALVGWEDGRYIYLLLASASVALMFATKETAFITLGTMLMACVCVRMWPSIRNGLFSQTNYLKTIGGLHICAAIVTLFFYSSIIDAVRWLYDNFLGTGKVERSIPFYLICFLIIASLVAWVVFNIAYRTHVDDGEEMNDSALTWARFRSMLGTRTDLTVAILAAIAIFLYVSILFFSSFFTYGEGIKKAVEAYTIWTKTGAKEHTQNGALAYLRWGMKVEAPILILSLLGAGIALIKGRHRFAVFTAFWALGLFFAYNIIPYKTPWLALSYLLPMCIIAGYGLGQMLTSKRLGLKVAGIILALCGTSVLAYQAYDLNFVRYDDEEMGYVYAHTKRGFLDLMHKVDFYAAKSTGNDATIEIVSPDYWPMTWYVLDYKHANFQGQFVDANTAEMIITKKNDQDAEAIRRYSAHYKFVGVWPLRPGVDLALLVRKDLAEPTDQDLYKLSEFVSTDARR